jgi:hypothetical protein
LAEPEFQYTELNIETMSVSGAPAIAGLEDVRLRGDEAGLVAAPAVPLQSDVARRPRSRVAMAAFTAGTTHHTAERPGSSSL